MDVSTWCARTTRSSQIPGNALSVHPDLPFRGLERFGVSFLSRFEGSQLPSSVLRSITLVDTPGILSGEKQRVNRGYDVSLDKFDVKSFRSTHLFGSLQKWFRGSRTGQI